MSFKTEDRSWWTGSRCACKVSLPPRALVSEVGASRNYPEGEVLKSTPCVSRGFVAAALRAWNSCNEYMPSRVIVYRDGVGDGQLKTLVNYEVPQFLDCLKSVGRGYK